MRVRVYHFWYDGPLVAADVELPNGKWVGCNISPIADELETLLAWADTADWPEGTYVFADGHLTPEATVIAFKPRTEESA